MSIKRRQLFVGVLDNDIWTKEKLSAYLTKHTSENDNQFIVNCDFMSYTEARFQGKSFAFVTFSENICVDRCMKNRTKFNEEYGMTMKRLLPDSTTKCERLMSTPDVVIRINLPDPLFTEENIRKYFGEYGKIIDLKMLEEENTGGICLITYDDFDSVDLVILDSPHYLNARLLSVHKYTPPEYICNLSQFRFVDETKAYEIKRWYPHVRNFTDLIRPLTILYKTQIALIKYNLNRQLTISKDNFNKTKEYLHEFENKSNEIKQNFIQLVKLNQQLRHQIGDSQGKYEKNKNYFEDLIKQQKEKNKSLENDIKSLQDNS